MNIIHVLISTLLLALSVYSIVVSLRRRPARPACSAAENSGCELHQCSDCAQAQGRPSLIAIAPPPANADDRKGQVAVSL